MLPVASLRDQFVRLRTRLQHGTTLEHAFCMLPFSCAKEFMEMGFHPAVVTHKWLQLMSDNIPHKMYLLQPKHVPVCDLLMAIDRHSNLEHYAKHIEYHKRRILVACDADMLSKCIAYMTLVDDDVRYILESYPEHVATYILSHTNADSMRTMSYHFSESAAEEFALVEDKRNAIMDHQAFRLDFLHRLFYRHGIIPTNVGMREETDVNFVLDVLSAISDPHQALRFLLSLDEMILTDVAIKQFILICIINGQRLRNFIWYAHQFLRDKVAAMHIYAPIFFDDITIDLSQHTLTRERLENICEFCHVYLTSVGAWATALIMGNHYDLLGKVIKHIPRQLLDECICIRAIKECPTKIKVVDIPIHSECILLLCHDKEYDDVIDFLDTIPLRTFEALNISPFSDYCFTTNWFNKEPELIDMFLKLFGFCGNMVRKLLFETRLPHSTIIHILDKMVSNPGMTLFSPELMCELRYLLCTTHVLNITELNIRATVCKEVLLNGGKEHIKFSSPHAYGLGVATQIYCFATLQTCRVKDLTYTEIDDTAYLQFIQYPYTYSYERDRVIKQIEDIGVLAIHGFFEIPIDYLPQWIPIFDLVAGKTVSQPTMFECIHIPSIQPHKFIRYGDLAAVANKFYHLKDPASCYHAALNILMSTLMVYIVIGTLRYVDNVNEIKEYVSAIMCALLRGLKINELLADTPPEVLSELKSLKNTCSSTVSGILIVPDTCVLKHTIKLCERVLVAIILYNNQCNKF